MIEGTYRISDGAGSFLGGASQPNFEGETISLVPGDDRAACWEIQRADGGCTIRRIGTGWYAGTRDAPRRPEYVILSTWPRTWAVTRAVGAGAANRVTIAAPGTELTFARSPDEQPWPPCLVLLPHGEVARLWTLHPAEGPRWAGGSRRRSARAAAEIASGGAGR